MARCARLLVLFGLLLTFIRPSAAVDARFDLIGPRVNVRVTRNGVTLPIAEVPNLQPGDRIWLHPDLPPTQSVKYLLICVFLRGSTNPPPDDWFTRIETWQKDVREEGVFVTVPKEAQQDVLFLTLDVRRPWPSRHLRPRLAGPRRSRLRAVPHREVPR